MSKPLWFNIENIAAAQAGAKPSARIKIFGVIGGGWLSDGVSARQFLNQLEMLGDVGHLEVVIDSPGGAVDDGLTIYDALRTHSAKVTTNVIGIAASMASVLMLAGDERQIAENGRVMVHRATGAVRGTHEELTRYAEVLKQNEDRIVNIYVEQTGQKEKDLRAMMNTMVGTWLFGKDAVDKGFAKTVLKGVKASAFHAEWRDGFDFIPAALFDSAASHVPDNTTPDITDMKPEEIQALITKGIEAGLASALTTHGDKMKSELSGSFKTEIENGLKPIGDRLGKVEAFGDQLKTLGERLEKAEGLIKSGVTGSAGGTTPVPGAGGEGGDEGGGAAAFKNEAEVRTALGKAKTFDEKRGIMASARKAGLKV